jgi:hypothetical protein
MADLSRDKMVAAAALLLLRSALAPHDRPTTPLYIMLPVIEPLSHDEMVDRLASLPKPIMCVATRVADALAIACWPPSKDTEDYVSELQEFRRRSVRTPTDHPDDTLVLRVPGDSAGTADYVVSRATYERLTDEYIIPNVDKTESDPDESARRQRASAILEYWYQKPGARGTITLDENGALRSLRVQMPGGKSAREP